MTATELHETFAPLRAEAAADDEVAAVLAAVPPAAPRQPRRRRARVVVALAGATAAAAALLAGLPAERPEPAGEGRAVHASDGASLLRAAAAVAAEQPAPAPFTGYRYTEWLDRWSYVGVFPDGTRAYEQRVETWVDKDWQGRRVNHPGRVLKGDPEQVKRLISEGERAYEYGDGLPRWKLETLPTEPRALREALLDEYRDGVNWAPGKPTADDQHYDLIRSVLTLLGDSNVTPGLRAAGFEILASTGGVRAAPGARDARGRTGRAVTIPTRRKDGEITIVFDPDTSAMLSWSETGSGGGTPDQTHTIIRSAQVDSLGDRP